MHSIALMSILGDVISQSEYYCYFNFTKTMLGITIYTGMCYNGNNFFSLKQ